jgi:hypothetical protein
MTVKWQVPKMFAGQTVAVLAPGPSLTQALADTVKHLARIAVRRAFRLAPDADMLVAIDGETGSLDDTFWRDARDFAGLKVTGTQSETLDALYLPIPHERVRLSEHHVVEFRNNGLAAIRIAAQAGAKKIVLVGFDTERYEQAHARTGFLGLTAGLAALTAELAGQGVKVERM